MRERTSLASLVAVGVSLLVATAIGMLKRPAHVALSGVLAGTVVWLVDWFTEVRAIGAEPSASEDEEAARLGVLASPTE